METIEKGFKYRIYPKDNQIEQIENMFNAKRYVYNYFLNGFKTIIRSDISLFKLGSIL